MKNIPSFAIWVWALPALTSAAAVQQRDTTTTIPYFGPSKTTVTLGPCSGPQKVVVETPFPKPVCPSKKNLAVPAPQCTSSTTIPYLGSTKTSTTVIFCSGTTSVIFETPLGLPSCTSKSTSKISSQSTSKSTGKSTSRSTSKSTSSSSRITTTPLSTRSSTSSSASSSKSSTISSPAPSSSSKATPSSTLSSSSLSTSSVASSSSSSEAVSSTSSSSSLSTSSSAQTITSASSTADALSTSSLPPIVPSSTDSPTTSSPAGVVPSGACSVTQINPVCLQRSGLDLDVAYYENPFYTEGYSNEQSTRKSNYYILEGLSPLATGSDSSISFDSINDYEGHTVIYPAGGNTIMYWIDWTGTVGGGITVDANNFTVVYQGYYRAPATDTFEMCAESDNEIDVYFGEGAGFGCVDGYTDPNSSPSFQGFLGNPSCRTYNLVAGAFYPIRAVVGNNQGPSYSKFTIRQGSQTAISDLTGSVYSIACLAQ